MSFVRRCLAALALGAVLGCSFSDLPAARDAGRDVYGDEVVITDADAGDVWEAEVVDAPDSDASEDGGCDGMVCSGVCVDLQHDSMHCGACGVACLSGQVCRGGRCEDRCAVGETLCGDVCVNTSSEVAHCGACGHPCPAQSSSRATCVSGACGAECFEGFSDCDGAAANGCEVDLGTSLAHCGACAHVCPAPANAVAACLAGTCSVTGCRSGYDDCDGDPTNGCEANLGNSLVHCGMCGRTCPDRAGATEHCMGATCGFSCQTGFGDCDRDPGNGCETNLQTSVSHCEACGRACGAGMVCSAGICSSICGPGLTLCGAICVNVGSSLDHCGMCGRACPAAANASRTCAGGTCGIACISGWGNCDVNAANGCEANLGSATSCGMCGRICPSGAHSTASCSGGTCGLACESGWGNCDGNAANGCETPLNTASNCNRCGQACPSRPHMTAPTCSMGGCASGCEAGWANCDGNLDNGCEANQSTSRTNCGSCGRTCPVACSGGTCVTVSSVDAGESHTCAVLSDGTVRCWGSNVSGQLGIGTVSRTPVMTPTPVPGLSSVASIGAGVAYNCVRLTMGDVRCWGSNTYGQLGDGTTTTRPSPVAVSGITGALGIAVGGYQACARRNIIGTAYLRCWGRNADGQVGDGTNTSPRATPTSVVGMSGGATEVQAGRYHTCARSGGDLYCWGHNGSGRLGDGTTTSRSRATLIDVLGDVEAITLGGSHTCTITRTTVLGMTLFPVYCWGSNTAGQLGIGSTTSQSTPALLRALSSQTIQVDAGEGHSCARISAGGVLCWGNNDFGQLGDGGTANRTTPTVIAGLTDVASIAAGDHHTCAVMTDGSLRCWGCNTDGQLGDGTNSHRGAPTRVVF